MRVNIVAEDKTVCVDGVCITNEYTFPEGLWAVHWNGVSGEVEYTGDTSNEIIVDFSVYQPIVDEWTTYKAELDAVPAEAPPEEEYTIKRSRDYPAVGDQLDALFHGGVFPADMAATIQAVKDAYPKP
jgi:hypothetical protein